LKFAATYDAGAPACALKTAGSPANHEVVPPALLLLAISHPTGMPMPLKPSANGPAHAVALVARSPMPRPTDAIVDFNVCT